MAKKKSKSKSEIIEDEIRSIAFELDAAYSISGECHFCEKYYNEDSEDDGGGENTAKATTAENMHELGWREVDSKKHGVIALACPECVQASDEER